MDAGHEFAGQVEAVGRSAVVVRTLDELEPAREPKVHLTLAATILKGRALDGVIRDATMLGASVFRPMTTGRSHVTSAPSEHIAARWRAIAIASAKQCRRAVVPTIDPVLPFPQVVSDAQSDLKLLLVEPVHEARHVSIAQVADRDVPTSVTVAVGP